ncbi:UDP-N-acetylglucosamine transferase subunit ALG14 isoform X1 [Pteropus medius]|uniref:UDP-N-acetylglucosamine transferase subunit ALG14 n=1 Tax=Pteropus vampyrus TaxID=132908 RepID=A0A6P6BYJ8_PTEVA|nr:UDP-N-acetylglucosamine transferase subunit ALG14 homolog isoform X1 [Pteropus vampyrus]XP_039725458.1 UDP-N-acetylglucosamine transferase subunit ALG14 homolog isoform X1 [Pteropus giganteus]
MESAVILAAVAGAAAVLLALRLWIVLHSRVVVPRESLSLMVVAGSGGHTTEILRLLEYLSNAYSPRHYVIADTDEMSAQKISSFELDRADRDPSTRSCERDGIMLQDTHVLQDIHVELHEKKGLNGNLVSRRVSLAGYQFPKYYIHRIPRSREVQQSWLSTVLSTLYSMWLSFPLTYRVKPDLASLGVDLTGQKKKVLCNGPGTCVPICVSALLLGILGIKKVIIVYVESICRVEHLSLSGKILFHLSDYFIVQWLTLKEKYPKSVYLGRIV